MASHDQQRLGIIPITESWSSDQNLRLRSPRGGRKEGRYHPHRASFTTASFVYIISVLVLSHLGCSFRLLLSFCLSMLLAAENISINYKTIQPVDCFTKQDRHMIDQCSSLLSFRRGILGLFLDSSQKVPVYLRAVTSITYPYVGFYSVFFSLFPFSYLCFPGLLTPSSCLRLCFLENLN